MKHPGCLCRHHAPLPRHGRGFISHSASQPCELAAPEGAAGVVFQRCPGGAVLVTPLPKHWPRWRLRQGSSWVGLGEHTPCPAGGHRTPTGDTLRSQVTRLSLPVLLRFPMRPVMCLPVRPPAGSWADDCRGCTAKAPGAEPGAACHRTVPAVRPGPGADDFTSVLLFPHRQSGASNSSHLAGCLGGPIYLCLAH